MSAGIDPHILEAIQFPLNKIMWRLTKRRFSLAPDSGGGGSHRKYGEPPLFEKVGLSRPLDRLDYAAIWVAAVLALMLGAAVASSPLAHRPPHASLSQQNVTKGG